MFPYYASFWLAEVLLLLVTSSKLRAYNYWINTLFPNMLMSSPDLGLSSGSSLVTAAMSWVLRAGSMEPVWKPSRQNPATGLLAVSLAERTLSSKMSPPSTTPKISTSSSSWQWQTVEQLTGRDSGGQRRQVRNTSSDWKKKLHSNTTENQ